LLANLRSSAGLMARMRATRAPARRVIPGSHFRGSTQKQRHQMPGIEPQSILGPLDGCFGSVGEQMHDGPGGEPKKHAGIARAQSARAIEHGERAVRIATQGVAKPVASADPYRVWIRGDGRRSAPVPRAPTRWSSAGEPVRRWPAISSAARSTLKPCASAWRQAKRCRAPVASCAAASISPRCAPSRRCPRRPTSYAALPRLLAHSGARRKQCGSAPARRRPISRRCRAPACWRATACCTSPLMACSPARARRS
jgi:hypothetical protein